MNYPTIQIGFDYGTPRDKGGVLSLQFAWDAMGSDPALQSGLIAAVKGYLNSVGAVTSAYELKVTSTNV